MRVYQFVIDEIVKVAFVVVQPDFGQSDVVVSKHVGLGRWLEWTPSTEDVAYVGAGDHLQGSSAHPSLRKPNIQKPLDRKNEMWITLKDNSMFSPPHSLNFSSNPPNLKNHSRSMANNPPIIVGVLANTHKKTTHVILAPF